MPQSTTHIITIISRTGALCLLKSSEQQAENELFVINEQKIANSIKSNGYKIDLAGSDLAKRENQLTKKYKT